MKTYGWNAMKKAVSEQNEAKTVCIFAKDPKNMKDFDKQLEHFGYSVTCAADFDAFGRAVLAKRPGVVIIYSDLSNDEAAWLRSEEQGKLRNSVLPRLIVISSRDDFDARLAAVRLGAQGFFSADADILQIIDKMEYLVTASVQHTFHVLLVEDDDMHVRFYTHVLQAAGIMTTVVNNPHEALDVITNQSIDLVLMDFIMPECSGQELATIIRQHEKYFALPIIIISARDDVESLLVDTGLGIDEFLVKPVTGDQLVSSVRSRAQRSAELQVLMARDSFTGLLNHDHFMDMLAVELGQVKRYKTNTVYAAIDIDNFKNINDMYGHVAGDHVIKSLSRLLQQRMRRSDIIGRCGGQEFSIIMPDCTVENATVVIESLRRQFAELTFKMDQQDVSMTFSAGITQIGNYESLDEVIKATNRALKDAKEQGRNRAIVA